MRKSKQSRAALAGATMAVALLATACGINNDPAQEDSGQVQPAGNDTSAGAGDGESADPDYGDGGSYGSGADSGYGASPAGGEKAAPAKELSVRKDPELGQIVSDSKGWTLYRFDKDTADPPQSNCEGDCAKAWPPVPAKDAEAASGMAKSELGKVKRADGSWQLTLGGWPAYRYAKDTSPGDTKGHGVQGTWNALAPDGTKAGAASGSSGGSGEHAKQADLKAVDNPELGKILTDAEGRTLYRFDKDSAWPMKSNCTGECLDTWKPAGPVSKSKLSGVAEKLVSTYTRPDGTKQLAVDCWPLYWFTGDEEPGDTNGQGKMGLWHAATDKGKKAAPTS